MNDKVTITRKAKPNFKKLGQRVKLIGETAENSNDFNIGEFLELYPVAYTDDAAALKVLAKDYPKKIYSQIESLSEQQIRSLQAGDEIELFYCGIPAPIMIDDIEVRYDAHTSDGSGVAVAASPSGLIIVLTTDVTEENQRAGDAATLCRLLNDSRRSAKLNRGELARCQMIGDATTRALFLDEELRQKICLKCSLTDIELVTSAMSIEPADGWHVSSHTSFDEDDDRETNVRTTIALAKVS